MLLGKIDGQTLQDLTSVTAQGTEERTVTVHDNEAELLVRLKQLAQGLGVELVVTKIKRGVDGLEGFKIDVNLAFLAFRGDDFTTVDDQAIWWNLVVQFETLLGGGNGRQDGESVHARLDVGGSTLSKSLTFRNFRASGGPGGMGEAGGDIHILQPTSSRRERSDPWGLHVKVSGVYGLFYLTGVQLAILTGETHG